MAISICENFSAVECFPTLIGEYSLDFDDEINYSIDNWTESSFIIRNNTNNFGHQTWGEDYFNSKKFPIQIFHQETHMLQHEEFNDLAHNIRACAMHFLKEVLCLKLDEDMHIDFSDSWLVKVTGSQNEEAITRCTNIYRPHKHSFSMISGVLFLEDSQNSFRVIKPSYDPLGSIFDFDCTNPVNKTYHDIECVKGRLIIFPSDLIHTSNICDNIEDSRFSIAFNIFPFGKISTKNTGKLAVAGLNFQQHTVM